MLDRPHPAGPADAGGHLVDHHQRAELVAQRAHPAHERHVVGEHPAGGLHQRLDDDRADLAGRVLERAAHLGEHLGGPRRRASWPGASTPGEDTVRVSSRIGRYVAWNSSMPPTLTAPEGVAVVALGDVQVERLGRPAAGALGLRLEGHLDRGLDRGRPVAGVEDPGQPGRGGRQQPLGQLDARLVGQPEEGRVVQPVQLRADRRVDLRHAVPVHRDPQRRDAVEVAVAVGVPEVHALGPVDDQRLVGGPDRSAG